MANAIDDRPNLVIPPVSVVVRTYNRSTLLAPCLNSLFRQTYPADKWEIVVVDNASTDDTKRIVEQFEDQTPKLRYVFEAQLGAARARVAGMNAARGEIIAWIDDDCIANQDWLECLLEGFEMHELTPAVVGGQITLNWEVARPWWMAEELDPTFGHLDYGQAPCLVRAVNGANMAWRVDKVLKLGDHHVELGPVGRNKSRMSEDVDLQLRIRQRGEKILFTPKAVVSHFIPREHAKLRYLLSRYFALGTSDSVRQQYARPTDRIDSLKRLIKSLIFFPLDIWRLLLLFPKRMLRLSPDLLNDLARPFIRSGFLLEEMKFQFSFVGRCSPSAKTIKNIERWDQ
jgi:glycosyltransferase involved in cell wall biosynthesis